MKKLERLVEMLQREYIFRERLPSEYELLRHYLNSSKDSYLRYVDNDNPFIGIYDLLGIKTEYVSESMVRIVDFFCEDKTCKKCKGEENRSELSGI